MQKRMGMADSSHDYALGNCSDWMLTETYFTCPIALPKNMGFLWIIWVSGGNQVGYASRP